MTLVQVLSKSVRFTKRQIFVETFCTNLQSPGGMEPPCWCTSVEHRHGGRKIVQTSGTYFGYLGDLLSALNKKHVHKSFS